MASRPWRPTASMAWPLRRLVTITLACVLGVIYLASNTIFSRPDPNHHSSEAIETGPATQNARIAQYFIDYPVNTSEFGEMGRRIQLLNEWMMETPTTPHPDDYALLLEKLAVALFPFIHDPSPDQNTTTPLRNLRTRYVKGSRGIVIPTGTGTFRYACHLILNLHAVLRSTLPIQIIYAGDSDLPVAYRDAIRSLTPGNMEFIDIFEVLDDTTMGLADAKWAIKPFAILASTFEEVILVDADAIFLQNPEVILNKHKGYKETGVLFFHDRLVGKGEYEARHAWWQKQLRHQTPSPTLRKSITMQEGYGQEADSGVIVIDKQRLNVLFGLLHACWQNSKEVREKETYKHTHGDKETYWLGMELSGVRYSFAENYGAALGSYFNGSIHTSTIAHVDEAKKLLWFNGSLLKKKDFGGDLREYFVPDRWMIGGNWTWTLKEEFMAYMNNTEQKELLDTEVAILRNTVQAAKQVDEKFGSLIELPEIVLIEKPGNSSVLSSTTEIEVVSSTSAAQEAAQTP